MTCTEDAREEALTDRLLGEDYYGRWALVQALHEGGDDLAWSMESLAARCDEDEREQRLGRTA